MTPKVSIIIPNYNHVAFLQQRLDSVFNQTFQDFEVILLDDASTDDSVNILETYKNHPKVSSFIVNTEDSGSPFKQWKKGIELATGKYIWIAESDDYCELDFLDNIIPKFKTDLDLCYCQTYDINDNEYELTSRILYTSEFQPNIWEKDFRLKGDAFNLNYLLVKNVIPNASAVVFKSSLVKDHFFDTTLLNMKMCGDWLFWMRLCTGNAIGFLNEHLNYFRSHKAISRTHDTQAKKRLRLVEEAIIRKEFFLKQGEANKQKENQLYANWFKLHGFKDVFKASFFDVIQPKTSKKRLFLSFIKLKIQKYIKL